MYMYVNKPVLCFTQCIHIACIVCDFIIAIFIMIDYTYINVSFVKIVNIIPLWYDWCYVII